MRSGNIIRTKTSVSTVVTLVIQAVTAPTHSIRTEYPLKTTKPNPNRPKHTPRNMREYSLFMPIALVTMMFLQPTNPSLILNPKSRDPASDEKTRGASC